MPKTIIDFHVIQTVPPSNLNRDDTGSPKTALYGGVQRARVSSQAWKKAIREMFREHFKEAELGMRTKRIVEPVAKRIEETDAEITREEALKLAEKAVNAAGVTTENSKTKGREDIREAKALFFISATQANALARLAAEAKQSGAEIDKAAAKDALNRKGHAVEIALFGRMVADDPLLNANASAQVAHSISVHKAENEYDYFTAVDDAKERSEEKEDAGAGMRGFLEFNSSTLYRYATVFTDLLYEELASDAQVTAKAVSEFARGFIASMPTGKQNTFANRTPAYAVLVTIREDQPLNFVGAFETPIKPSEKEGFARRATRALARHADNVYRAFARPPLRSYVAALDEAADILAEQKNRDGSPCRRLNLDELLEALADEMRARFGGASDARPKA
ncbi:MAG: type I-E CRISPR-associated protein Cas7/Cse4/CasC [Clostridiales Family XIII bacterium]|jgi:CRISPR system Cascade subunit CasC|nr:type I-E CRISPR-associated protein Cas7/Cse4/CasC [Clostridiales Family XIII bacterium]